MPDAVAAEPIQLKPTEVLAFGSEAALVSQITPQAATHAAELRTQRAQGTKGREAFRQNIAQAEHAAYTPQSGEGLKVRYGGGAASLDAQGRAVLNANATPEQQAVFNEAVTAIDRSSRVLTYLQLLNQQNPQTQFQALQQPERPDLQNISNWEALRREALNTIANDPSFRNMFPELYRQGVTDANRRAYIEATLAQDPLFRAKIGERMAGVYTAAMQLPEIGADRPIQEARQRQAEQETAYNQQADNLVQLLTGHSINQLTIPGVPSRVINVDRVGIQQLLQAAPNTDSARNTILQGIMNCDAQILTNVQDLEINIPNQLNRVQEQMMRLLAPVMQNQNLNPNKLRQALQNIPGGQALLNQETQLQQQLQNLQNTLVSGGPMAQADQAFQNIAEPLLEAGVTQQNTQGEFGSLLSQAKGTQINIDRIRQQIAGLQAVRTPERTTQEVQRMLAERRLLGQLDTIFGEAVADVMEKRYDEMLLLEQKKQQEDAKKTEEKKGARAGRAQRQVQQEENERWIRIDPTTGKVIRCTNIAEDIDLLIYQGDNGRRRWFMRSIFGSDATFTVSRINAQGNKTDRKVNWQTFNFVTDELKGENKAVFDTVYEAESANMTKKLMTDYFLARSVGQVGGWIGSRLGRYRFEGSAGQLYLKNYEFEALNKNFGAEIDATLKESKEAQQVIKTLSEKGVPLDHRLRWLIYILVALGILAGLGLFAVRH